MSKIDVWVVVRGAGGTPDLVAVRLDCNERELLQGLHYGRAIAKVAELGCEPIDAFCENPTPDSARELAWTEP